jgi:hypothetical protein
MNDTTIETATMIQSSCVRRTVDSGLGTDNSGLITRDWGTRGTALC